MTEEKQTIPVDWNDPEFQKKFVQVFNLLESRVTMIEKIVEPLVKQQRIKQLKEELEKLEKE